MSVQQFQQFTQYEYSVDWFSANVPAWAHIFARVIPGAKKFLEIGSFEGKSTVWLIETIAHKNEGEIFCVDTWEGGEEHNKAAMGKVENRFDANVTLALLTHKNARMTKIKSTSRAALAGLINSGHANSFDFVYVDGSHQAPDVLEDLVGAFQLCKVGGVIACDDYLWKLDPNSPDHNPLHAPKMAIDAFVNCFIGKLEILPIRLYQLYLVKKSV